MSPRPCNMDNWTWTVEVWRIVLLHTSTTIEVWTHGPVALKYKNYGLHCQLRFVLSIARSSVSRRSIIRKCISRRLKCYRSIEKSPKHSVEAKMSSFRGELSF
jgi:hypothetical protein